MAHFKSDPRIKSPESINPNKSILVDSYSLATIAKEEIESKPSYLTPQMLSNMDSGRTLANLIQNIILYHELLVDSVLIELHCDIQYAMSHFPGIINGVFIRPSIRKYIGDVIDSGVTYT